MMQKIILNNQTQIDILGFGTYKLLSENVTQLVKEAFKVGYRHIDTASIYNNEEAIGEAIKQSGLARKDLFITTKIWPNQIRSGNFEQAIDESLNKLKLDYVDLYLLHWPVKDLYISAWLEMEKLYTKGKAKAIGVSNYNIEHLEGLLKECSIIPAVNQIELHPYLVQQKLTDFCKEKGIMIEAWSPIARGNEELLNEPILLELSKKYNKTPVQIILRWNIEREIIIFPKASNYQKISENFNIFDFSLSNDEVSKINLLDRNQRFGNSPADYPY